MRQIPLCLLVAVARLHKLAEPLIYPYILCDISIRRRSLLQYYTILYENPNSR
jgi:hypothetical protein